MMHINIWSQSLDSGVSVSFKGRRKAPRYCHELEIAFADGNAVSIWAAPFEITHWLSDQLDQMEN